MVSNALTTSMSPKFTLFRDMGVRGWGDPPKVLSPLLPPDTTSTPSCTYCVFGGGGTFFHGPRKKERGLVQRQGKGGFGVIPDPS